MDAALAALLSRCYPFQHARCEDVAALCHARNVQRYAAGQPILKRADAAGSLLYLVAGKGELRRSFFDRVRLVARSEETLQPLNQLLTGASGQIVAVSDDCATLSISRDLVDKLLAAGVEQGYGVTALHGDGTLGELEVSDGAVDVDWMSRFLRSPFAHQLSAIAIQQLLACLQSRDVARGETIVRRGDDGDALYILTRGMAVVKTDHGSAFRGKEIGLMPGDHFGEESLVADTIRNASVMMETDGSVARLDRVIFNELVRPQFVREASLGELENPDIIDVRFAAEYRRGAMAGSRNLPIPLVRAQLHDFEPQRHVLVAREGGRRAELAVFLLRQAGLQAWLPRAD